MAERKTDLPPAGQLHKWQKLFWLLRGTQYGHRGLSAWAYFPGVPEASWTTSEEAHSQTSIHMGLYYCRQGLNVLWYSTTWRNRFQSKRIRNWSSVGTDTEEIRAQTDQDHLFTWVFHLWMIAFLFETCQKTKMSRLFVFWDHWINPCSMQDTDMTSIEIMTQNPYPGGQTK